MLCCLDADDEDVSSRERVLKYINSTEIQLYQPIGLQHNKISVGRSHFWIAFVRTSIIVNLIAISNRDRLLVHKLPKSITDFDCDH